MAAFVPAMLDAFATTSPEPKPTAPGRESDPQRTAPPALAVDAMRWLPKPSTATAAVGIGLVAAAELSPRSPLRKRILS
ncbi:MAG: intracellular protease, PfpI family [Mycobacterium sp.]|jgi:protease I|nr:intracellular protease, PfpI family [Mycobacterium sp.]